MSTNDGFLRAGAGTRCCESFDPRIGSAAAAVVCRTDSIQPIMRFSNSGLRLRAHRCFWPGDAFKILAEFLMIRCTVLVLMSHVSATELVVPFLRAASTITLSALVSHFLFAMLPPAVAAAACPPCACRWGGPTAPAVAAAACRWGGPTATAITFARGTLAGCTAAAAATFPSADAGKRIGGSRAGGSAGAAGAATSGKRAGDGRTGGKRAGDGRTGGNACRAPNT